MLSSVCQSRFHGRLPHNNHNHNNNTIHENNASVIAFPWCKFRFYPPSVFKTLHFLNYSIVNRISWIRHRMETLLLNWTSVSSRRRMYSTFEWIEYGTMKKIYSWSEWRSVGTSFWFKWNYENFYLIPSQCQYARVCIAKHSRIYDEFTSHSHAAKRVFQTNRVCADRHRWRCRSAAMIVVMCERRWFGGLSN